MNALVKDEKFQALIEEVEAIVVEKSYEYQSAKVELFWLTGEALHVYAVNNKVSITELVQKCAEDNRLSGRQMGERNLFWALKIYDAFPTKAFPEEKATSISKIKKLLSSEPDEKKEADPASIAEGIIKKYGYQVAKNVYKELKRRCDQDSDS